MMSPQPSPIVSAIRRLAAGAVLGFVLPGTAHAVPPTADQFNIQYWVTDENGDKVRAFGQQDMQWFVNQARCDCDQNIVAEIRVIPGGTQFDNTNRIRSYVGSNCEQGQLGNTDLYRPCALLDESFPNNYTKTVAASFSPLWLGSGVLGSDQNIATASPAGTCTTGTGTAGIFVCAEDNMAPGCTGSEWLITGTSNINVDPPVAISFDFDPPIVELTDITISPGDGAIELSWSPTSSGDAYGFRLLCADAENDQPVPGKGYKLDDVSAISTGTIYFTQENLCPAGPFEADGGTTDATDSSGSSDGSSSSDSSSSSGDSTSSSDSSSSSGDTGETDGAESGTTGGTTERPSTGIESLDWAYVCSGHVSGTAAGSTKLRVSGLDNGVDYRLLIVAYDQSGNPFEASEVLTATPRATTDLWEQCEMQGGVCGDGGFCSFRATDTPGSDPLIFLGLAGLGLVSRRRRRAR